MVQDPDRILSRDGPRQEGQDSQWPGDGKSESKSIAALHWRLDHRRGFPRPRRGEATSLAWINAIASFGHCVNGASCNSHVYDLPHEFLNVVEGRAFDQV